MDFDRSPRPVAPRDEGDDRPRRDRLRGRGALPLHASTRTSPAGSARTAARERGGSRSWARLEDGPAAGRHRPAWSSRGEHAVPRVLRARRRRGVAGQLVHQFFRDEYEEHVRLGRCPLEAGPADAPNRRRSRPGRGSGRRCCRPASRCWEVLGVSDPAATAPLTIDGTPWRSRWARSSSGPPSGWASRSPGSAITRCWIPGRLPAVLREVEGQRSF